MNSFLVLWIFGLYTTGKYIQYKLLVTVYKCINVDIAPQYLCSMLTVRVPPRNLRSATDTTRLALPDTTNNAMGDRAFSVCGPDLWNELPSHISPLPKVAKFKKTLKTHLFATYFC